MAEAAAPPAGETAPADRRAVKVAALVVAALFILAGALWARYGGAVFVELLAAAWAACF